MNFDVAFAELLSHEGGYSDDSHDGGGKTRYGITEAVARANGYTGDMRELPLSLAQSIYRAKYWDAVKADQLPDSVRYVVFDAAVNSGVGQAAKWLQRAVGVDADGVIGPVTIAAANQLDGQALKSRLLAQRLRFMVDLPNWPHFSRGWARRIASLMEA